MKDEFDEAATGKPSDRGELPYHLPLPAPHVLAPTKARDLTDRCDTSRRGRTADRQVRGGYLAMSSDRFEPLWIALHSDPYSQSSAV